MANVIRNLLLVAVAAHVALPNLHAVNDDLVMGFSGGGAGSDYVINLGNATTAVGVGGSNRVDLSADFSLTSFNSVFGGGQANWGAGGGTSSLNPDTYLTVPRVGGASTPATAGSSAPVANQTLSDGSATAGYFNAVLNNTAGFSTLAQAGGSAVIPVSDPASWTAKVAAPAVGGSLLGDKGINVSMPIQTPGVFLLDLYHGVKSGSLMNYAYVGFFTLDPTARQGHGTLSFTPAGAAAPPATAAISIGNATVSVGSQGATNASFSVELSAAANGVVTVAYATADGTARAPVDYTATSGVLTFPAGTTNLTLTVPVLGHADPQPQKTFSLTLSNPSGATLARAVGTGAILYPLPTLTVQSVTVTEAATGVTNALFVVSLSAPSAVPITVSYSTSDGTAAAPAEYTTTSGMLTFSPGVTNLTLTVPVLNDADTETNETFALNLSSPTNATIAAGTATCTVLGNPGPVAPTLAISWSTDRPLIAFPTVSGATYQLRYTNHVGLGAPLTTWALATNLVQGDGTVRSLPGLAGRADQFYVIQVSRP